jgi:hypothetical protein
LLILDMNWIKINSWGRGNNFPNDGDDVLICVKNSNGNTSYHAAKFYEQGKSFTVNNSDKSFHYKDDIIQWIRIEPPIE